MSESILQKVQGEAKAFLVAPVYPFLQKDWLTKMWIFAALSYVPVVNVVIARGWRMDYIHRLGWSNPTVIPAPRDLLLFLKNGLLLWLSTSLFLAVPLVVIMSFGLGGLLDLVSDIGNLLGLLIDYAWNKRLSTGEFLRSLWLMFKNELFSELVAFTIEHIWLVLYIPIYRVGMIRFALTGDLLRSHLAIKKNLRFLFHNFVDIVLMYAFNIFNFLLVIVVDTLLTLTAIGVPLIPIITFFMPYWNSGYEYGLLARVMVEQEQLTKVSPQSSYQPEHVTALAAPALPLPIAAPAIGRACPNCNLAYTDTPRFCTACGAPLPS